MKLIITDTYPKNGEKTFVVDSIYMDRLLSILDDCKELPDRAAQLLRAPVQSEQNEAFKNDDIIELLYKLAGLVETAGIYGNVRVSDVEFAKYCLNRVEPLIRLRSNRSAGG